MQPITKEQGLVITGFTGITAVDFGEFQLDVKKRLGRPVFTHELADKELWKEIKELYRADFLNMVREA